MASKTTCRSLYVGTQKRPRLSLFKSAVRVLLIVITAGVALAEEGNMTEIPTPSPTNVTAPTTRFPSRFPTSSPTTNATQSPTESSIPSQSPSASGRPSILPSYNPSAEPSTSSLPSSIPSAALTTLSPSSSLMPSTSVEPSLRPSATPSLWPSSGPTARPSVSNSPSSIPSGLPSIAPSLSAAPSTTPSTSPSFQPTFSQKPSGQPSVSSSPSTSPAPSTTPSSMPSDTPSTDPTSTPTTPLPTRAPSISPSSLPSVQPTPSPTRLPSSSPTLTKIVVSEEKIIMVFKGLTEPLDRSKQLDWERITSNQIVTYYDDLLELLPGIVHIAVFTVDTTLKKQRVIDNPEVAGQRNLQSDEFPVLLELEYRQTITYGLLFEKEEEVTTEQLFVEPIWNDLQEYLVELIVAFDLEGLIYLEGLTVGDPTPSPNPGPAPTSPPTSERGTSRVAAVGISLTIVFLVIFVASMILYRRYKQDMRHRPEQMLRDEQETTEFDNTGQNVDWRNPYYPRPPGQHSGPSTLPQDNPDVGGPRNSSGTVFTDLTESDLGQGQDNGSENGAVQRLRTVLKDSGYGSNDAPLSPVRTPLSPVHIPSDYDDDHSSMGMGMDMHSSGGMGMDVDVDVDVEDMNYMPEATPPQDLLGLGDDDDGTPSQSGFDLNGFDLQIQELE